MRFWYCDRASITVSQSFDFTEVSHHQFIQGPAVSQLQDCRTLLSFLVRVLFAEEQDLGFDPTMTVYKTLDDGTRQYDISVRQTDGTCQIYRTKGILSDNGGVYLQGRGTRVWSAVRVEDGVEIGDVIALKDSWVDEYREREALLNARIQDSANSEDDRQRLGEMTVQVLSYGDVYVHGGLDRTRMNPEGAFWAFTSQLRVAF